MKITIADRKLHTIELITRLEDEDLLALIEQLLGKVEEQNDWADTLSDEERSDISEGLKDLDAGKSMNYEVFKKKMKKRYP